MAKRKRIGEILVEAGLVTEQQVDFALKEGGGRLGKALISLGYLTAEDISRALASQYNLEYVDLKNRIIDASVYSDIPEALARKHVAIPIDSKGGRMTVVVFDPLNVMVVDDFSRHTTMRIKLAVSTEGNILDAINRHYVSAKNIEDIVKKEDLGDFDLLEGEAEAAEKLQRIADDVSIVRLVNMVMSEAVEKRASDIHIEPDADTLRVRFRIDGVLHDAANLPMKVHPAVTSRIKIMGGMDIAEKRLPQDGRFVTVVGKKEIDMRISTLPAIFGEKLVMRLLDKEALIDIEILSPCKDSIQTLNSLIKKPYGMILITGPTGSGKSTTLYSLLDQLDSMENNIVTVEDPVEYQIQRINQIQVNPKAGLNFAEVLRHILRQDPDIIMIGEIRDRETAEIATHAALTGHLVLSSLHTNDVAGTVGRLIDMGVEPFLVVSSVIGIANQRLVRKICQHCKTSYEPEAALLREFGLPPDTLFYRGDGCGQCKGTSYRGRLSIVEVVKMGPELRKMTLERMDSAAIKAKIKELGFCSLRDEGVKAVVDGLTTIDEIIRVTQEVEDL